mgnify:CR=1 FL=1
MNFMLKSYEDIDRKLEFIKDEIRKVSGNNKNKLLRLAGKEEALRWVMGRGII